MRSFVNAAQRRAESSNRFSVLSDCIISETAESEHFHIPATISGNRKSKDIVAMVDSGASTLFLNKQFVRENNVKTRRLKKPIAVYNIDGTPNKAGAIEEIAVLALTIGEHVEKTVFTITDIGPEDVIIGIDWLRRHNPEINWDEGTLKLNRCPNDCQVTARLQSTSSTYSGEDLFLLIDEVLCNKVGLELGKESI